MKRALSLVMAALMLVSVFAFATACSRNGNDGEVTDNEDGVVTEGTEDTTAAEGEDTAAGETAEDSIAKTLAADFKEQMKADTKPTAQEIADELLKNEVIKFSGATMPVEEGLLTGFGNTEIKGFESGVMFAPMIGSIAFVGYIFDLADGTNAADFTKTLTDNADPRWNICVTADETVVENVDDMVFFLMAPTKIEG